MKARVVIIIIIISVALINFAQASTGQETASHATTFLWIAIILLAAKIFSLIERFGQPAVLGELIAGVVLGNLALVGIQVFDPLKNNSIISFLSELGVVILLFQIGLESNIQQMRKVGWRAFLVATVGVVVPFILGAYIVGPALLPGLSTNTYLFLGATLTATSVGITARVFRDLGKLQTAEAQIVLGAAVIDDVMGLIILAVVSAIVSIGTISVGTVSWITAKALAFLIGAIILGRVSASYLGKILAKVYDGAGMKLTLAISFGLFWAYLAQKIGLAPIVGAFAAGLVLDPVHFRYFREPEIVEKIRNAANQAGPAIKERLRKIIQPYSDRHVEEIIQPISYFLVPIFFIMTGFNVKLDTLFNWPILILALGITVAAFGGKIISGVIAGKVNKWVVGFGMIPRGEVGLIFAMMGKSLGVVSDEIFSALVIMVIFSTLITPPILAYLLRKKPASIVG